MKERGEPSECKYCWLKNFKDIEGTDEVSAGYKKEGHACGYCGLKAVYFCGNCFEVR